MSAKIVFKGESFVFGAGGNLPLAGWPTGKVKIKLRNDSFAWGYVKTPEGIAKYAVKEKDGFWIPGPLQGVNLRKNNL
jgi:hypothetical protein